MGITLYLDPCTINSRKVLSGLDLLKVPFDEKFVSFFKGEQKSEDYTKINPCQTVPAAVIDGDLILTESNSILQYAGDIAKDESFYPKDLKKRAQVNRWLLWETSVWFGNNYVYVIENVAKPWIFKADPDAKALGEEEPKWRKGAGILNEQLGKSKFLVGDTPTIADIAVAAPLHLWGPSKAPIDDYPNLKRWIQDVEKIPEWANRQAAVDDSLMPGHKDKKAANGANSTKAPVRATINYTKDLGDRLTEIYFYEDPKAAGVHEPGDDPHEMSFYDGWDRAKEWSEDKHGFALKDFQTSFSEEWEDEDAVRSKFYPEVVEFLKKETGAKRILVFDHTIRTAANQAKKLTQESNTSQRAPVMLVHCDYTAESGPLRVRQLLPDEGEELLKSRVAFINVWKPLNVVEERPLAMCDVESAPPDDFFKLYLRYRDRTGENYVMRHADRHKWYYFPKMNPEQVILLKTYDSDKSRAQFVGHTAFEDPTSPKDAKMRESVEIRTIAFF